MRIIFQGHKVKILATVQRTVGGSKTKTLNEDQTLQITSQAIIESGVIGLGKADVFETKQCLYVIWFWY